MCDFACLGGDTVDPKYQESVDNVTESIDDSFTMSMLNAARHRAESCKENSSLESLDEILRFPPEYEAQKSERVAVHCFPPGKSPDNMVIGTTPKSRFELPKVDPFLGDLGFFDELCYFGKFSNGTFGSSFDEQASLTETDWTDVAKTTDELKATRDFFTAKIGTPLYGIDDVTQLQNPHLPFKRNRQLNDWEEVDTKNLRNKNQILSALLGDNFEGDEADMWLVLMAFCGFAAHRTLPYDKKNVKEAYFCNDVMFLNKYEVRKGYEKYGAAAYFDSSYHLIAIEMWDKQMFYPPTSEEKKNKTAKWNAWMHAKWAWKVSVCVATFLVDMLAHCRFVEGSAMAKCLQEYLPEDHPMRRLMTPFTLGTVHSNRVMNEHLRENGLYHRAFAFTYEELQKLVRSSMEEATKNQNRERIEGEKYRFRLFRKKLNVMKALPDQVFPLQNDSWTFWLDTLKFVELYAQRYYGNDDRDQSKLEADKDLLAFFNALLEEVGVGPYSFKKFNVINVLTHFICNATIWNHQLSMAVSFEYSVDNDYVALKIVGNGSQRTNIENYVEYCAVVLSRGWEGANLMLKESDRKTSVWRRVLIPAVDDPQFNSDPPPEDQKEEDAEAAELRWGTEEIFKNYFEIMMPTLQEEIEKDNNDQERGRIAPYNGCNPRYVQSSICM